MDEKNVVINNYATALNATVNNITSACSELADNDSINRGIIKTLYVYMTSIQSQVTLLQQELDNY